MSESSTSPFTLSSKHASAASGFSGSSSISLNTRSAAEKADCNSPKMFAVSFMGPENLREYSTNADMSPIPIMPFRYSIAPNTLTSASDTLFIQLTDGPIIEP